VDRFVVVREVDPTARRADVVVYPESCGRCEDDGGHCVRDHRTVPAWIPDGVEVHPGDRVRLVSNRAAVLRGLFRVIGLPAGVGLAGLYLGGFRFGDVAPQAIAQVTGRSVASLGVPVEALVLAVLGAGAAVLFALRRGVRPQDWPTVTQARTAEPVEDVELRPVSISRSAADLSRS